LQRHDHLIEPCAHGGASLVRDRKTRCLNH
jgi:hypothetical protein